MLREKHINFVSSPTENLQARYISTWLKEHGRYADGNRTAIVLCDEGLLQTVVHCIPPEVEQMNITTGYPLQQTPVATLVQQLLDLQLKGWDNNRHAFRLHYINAVLRHPYSRYISPQAQTIFKELNTAKVFYVSPVELGKDDGMAELFTREGIAVDTSVRADGYDIIQLLSWLMAVVRRVAVNGAANSCFRNRVSVCTSC